MSQLVFGFVHLVKTEGIEVPCFNDRLRGSIVQVTGDILGLHCLFGYVESFSARYCCRFCLTEKGKFQTVFYEDDPSVTLQTIDIHLHHCEAIQLNLTLPHVYGVKCSCLLNEFKNFNTVKPNSVFY